MRRMTIGALLVVIVAVIGISLADAQDPPRIRCTWERPETGSPVEYYELQVKDVDGGLDTTFTVPSQPGVEQVYVFEGRYLRRYVARVRGFDGQGRNGPWSPFCPVYVFEEEDPEP